MSYVGSRVIRTLKFETGILVHTRTHKVNRHNNKWKTNIKITDYICVGEDITRGEGNKNNEIIELRRRSG